MQQKDLIITRTTAEKLRSLGVKRKSYFYYLLQNAGSGKLKVSIRDNQVLEQGTGGVFIPAYTSQEISRMMPDWIHTHKMKGIYFECENYDIALSDGETMSSTYARNEAEARGLMLVYLLENGLHKVR